MVGSLFHAAITVQTSTVQNGIPSVYIWEHRFKVVLNAKSFYLKARCPTPGPRVAVHCSCAGGRQGQAGNRHVWRDSRDAVFGIALVAANAGTPASTRQVQHDQIQGVLGRLQFLERFQLHPPPPQYTHFTYRIQSNMHQCVTIWKYSNTVNR